MEKELQIICDAISSKKGVLIKILKVRDITSIADYFIISTTTNKKQCQAAADEVEDKMKEIGNIPLRKEGYREGQWILLDFGDVVVHIFTDEERRHFDFDSLWAEALEESYHNKDVGVTHGE